MLVASSVAQPLPRLQSAVFIAQTTGREYPAMRRMAPAGGV